MIKTKFWHHMKVPRLRCTVAIDVPSKETLIELGRGLLERGEKANYSGNLGVAKVNPKDRHFVKKIGRQVASGNAVDSVYWLMSVYRENDGTVYKFHATPQRPSEEHAIEMNLFIKPDSNVVHVSFVNVSQIKRR